MKVRLGLVAALGVVSAASAAFAQVVVDAVPLMSQRQATILQEGMFQPSGPADLHDARMPRKFSTFSTDPSQSALMQPAPEVPEGGWPIPETNTGGGLKSGDLPGGDSRFIDQPLDCTIGYFSNNNHNSNPYLSFDDFRADGSPLRNVRFYGGVFGGSGSLNAISRIGIEIWSIRSSGDSCGWTYNSLQGLQHFTVGQLAPQFQCNDGGFDVYEFNATFDTAIPLSAGQVYMITIYATLVNPAGAELFAWNQSPVDNFNPATSWDRNDGSYDRCGPGMAFATNVDSDCYQNDCQTTCWFSNYFSNTNPYISLDDFTASQTGDLRQLQFTGGVYDTSTGTGALLGNISGFYIEVYGAVADNNFPCGNFVGGFLGAFTVNMADARPVYDCTDIFGIPHYQFTVNIPAGVYPLTAGQNYMLGVYGIPANPNSTQLFCWGGTDAVYGFTSWSYNLGNNQQEVCHDPDQAFCINGARPCFGDFNKDGNRNTQDVLAFLNAWTASDPRADFNDDGNINTQDVLAFLNAWAGGEPAADCDGDGVVNTLDVLCFLNAWSAGCP